MRALSIMFWLSLHIMLGVTLIYPLVSKPNVVKGIEESLRIGIAR